MFNKILVIRNGAIGDTITLLPVIANLRYNFPDSFIELSGYKERLVLGVHPKYADICSSFECSGIPSIISSLLEARPAKYEEAWREGKGEGVNNFLKQFDLVLAFVADKDGAFAENLKTIGVKKFLVVPPFPPPGKRIHITDYLLGSIKQLGINIKYKVPEIFLPVEELEFAADFFENNKLSGKRIIAVHPGSGSIKKCWPKEKFLELANILTIDGYKILLISGPADLAITKYFKDTPAVKDFILAENLPLMKLAAVLGRSSCYIGNDSGITHLAAATGIPTIAIFGPSSNPETWAPRGKSVVIIFKDNPDGITTEEVKNAVFELKHKIPCLINSVLQW